MITVINKTIKQQETMTDLQNYLQDGACSQSRATLMFLQAYPNIESSWNKERSSYDADIQVSRWENCREQGYVVSLRAPNSTQLNIAFFEHRNSDNIEAVKWEQSSMNSLTIENAEFGDVYKTKYDTSHSVGHGKANEMAEWIKGELTKFWDSNIQSN